MLNRLVALFEEGRDILRFVVQQRKRDVLDAGVNLQVRQTLSCRDYGFYVVVRQRVGVDRRVEVPQQKGPVGLVGGQDDVGVAVVLLHVVVLHLLLSNNNGFNRCRPARAGARSASARRSPSVPEWPSPF